MRLFTTLFLIPRGIWALGFVSLFMDVSSELVHSLLPVFMVGALGASMATVGWVEGIAESTALIVKIFSGALSDYLGKRKLLTGIGYALAAISKPLFPLAGSVATVLAARFLDRIGKGIRGAPRDALIGDLAPPDLRGAAFGLRQALDTVGAFLGPLLAMLLLWLWAGNIRAVLWVAVIPAAASVLTLVFGVKEPEPAARSKRTPLSLAALRAMAPAFWRVTAIAGVLTLARFSEAFLILKARDVGVPLVAVPLVLIVMNIVYMLSAYPAGEFSDGPKGRRGVLMIGVCLLIAADVALATTHGVWMLALGVGLWGLHMGLTQGLLAAMVTDTAPTNLRGTAYGAFNFVSGIALLVASVLAGSLWDAYGPAATFLTGAAFAALALIGLVRQR